MTVSQVLAQFVASASPDTLGPADWAGAKAAISDCIACTVAGAATPTGAIVRKVAAASSGDGPATVMGSGRSLSPQAAALANGTAGHALDYDDILWTQYGHPSVAVLPAALALAEATGASGRELIMAYAIGVEIIGKFGRAANPQHYEHGWHSTATMGVIGAAAASAKLMGLNPQQTAMALGLAASQASGVRRNFGTMTKPFHAGNAARAGILSAELAREGFTSDLRAFEGEVGWAHVLQARSMPAPEQWAASLGQPWELSAPGIVLKRYPACGCTHCALDALLAICKEHQIKAEEIDKIDCDASPLAKKVLLYPRPVTGLEGKFSMEFSLAVAAVEGQAGPSQYEDHWTQDARVQALLPKISFRSRADLEPDVSADAVPAEVTVHARGQSYTRKVLVPSGDPRNPMTQAERREKFMACTLALVPTGAASGLFDALEDLEHCTDLRALLTPLRSVTASAVV
ncbi:MAG: MmgE/PrpD family protein [Betaproteobacteria bacterium]